MPLPTSPTQFAAARRGETPAPDRVAEHLWSIPIVLPAEEAYGGVEYTLCYLLKDGRDRIHVVDPGWTGPAALETVERGLALAGSAFENVASILVTHQHPDHLGGAELLRDATHAPIVLHEEEQSGLRRRAREGVLDLADLDVWGVPDSSRPELEELAQRASTIPTPDADILLRDGDDLESHGIETPGLELRFLRTPGHTPGSVCILDGTAGVIFTGDHVLPHIFPGLGLGGSTATNPISDYFLSLETVSILDDEWDGDLEVAPGHGYRFRGLADRCRELAEHHRRRNAEVAVAVQELGVDATVWGIAESIRWSRGFENMHHFMLGSALRQTAAHVDLLRREGALDR